MSRRPALPNADATYAFLDQMTLNMPHTPPFHTEIIMPELPKDTPGQPWPTWEEVDPTKN